MSRAGLVWESDTLVWDNRTLIWEQVIEPPVRIGNVLMVKRSRAKVLKVKNSKWRRRVTE